MRISELADATGTALATIKFYIREGMLPKGTLTSATSADYSDEHVKRVRLIQALSDVRGLSLGRVKEILEVIDQPSPDPMENLGRAISALPPYVDEAEAYPQARATLEALGFAYDPCFAGVGQLEKAIEGVTAAGLDWTPDKIGFYGSVAMEIAQREIAPMVDMPPEDVMAYAVLGTALYEPVLLALRRLAHQTTLSHLPQVPGPVGDAV